MVREAEGKPSFSQSTEKTKFTPSPESGNGLLVYSFLKGRKKSRTAKLRNNRTKLVDEENKQQIWCGFCYISADTQMN